MRTALKRATAAGRPAWRANLDGRKGGDVRANRRRARARKPNIPPPPPPPTPNKKNIRQEDERMVAVLAELEGGGGVPRSWARVSALMPWRTAKACAQRWLSCLAPALKAASQAPWTDWEMAVLEEAVLRLTEAQRLQRLQRQRGRQGRPRTSWSCARWPARPWPPPPPGPPGPWPWQPPHCHTCGQQQAAGGQAGRRAWAGELGIPMGGHWARHTWLGLQAAPPALGPAALYAAAPAAPPLTCAQPRTV